jgi:hypothetical protein
MKKEHAVEAFWKKRALREMDLRKEAFDRIDSLSWELSQSKKRQVENLVVAAGAIIIAIWAIGRMWFT